MNNPCRLCGGKTKAFFKENHNREFVECKICKGIQLLPEFFISPRAEEERYLTHNNDVEDIRYQNFVSPITSAVLADFTTKHTGLDYGCGTGPVATTELEKKGYTVKLYDPFFYPDTRVLENSYDFIICCEVMEHFYEPKKEFTKLFHLLKSQGKLYCKTSLYLEEIDFKNWYYKNDPTHVFLYTEKTLKWIKENLNFQKVAIFPKLIIFSK